MIMTRNLTGRLDHNGSETTYGGSSSIGPTIGTTRPTPMRQITGIP